jgi:hypothetical protein
VGYSKRPVIDIAVPEPFGPIAVQPLLAGIEELIDQVGLDANSTSEKMGDEHLRKRRLLMDQPEDRRLLDPGNH